MAKQLRALIVEDSVDDALLLVRELQQGGYELTYRRVDTASAMTAALGTEPWDIVYSDYYLPSFSGLEALEIAKSHDPDIPFILVSGGAVETAIVAEIMRAGARDCVMKRNLARLVPATERELRESAVRREHRRAEQALRESEARYRSLVEQSPDGIFVTDGSGNILDANSRGCAMLGYTREELLHLNVKDIIPPEDRGSNYMCGEDSGTAHLAKAERRLLRRDGTIFPVDVVSKVLPDGRVQCIARDITPNKRKEIQIQQQIAFLNSVIESLPHPFYVVDANDYTIRIANSATGLGKLSSRSTCYSLTHGQDEPCSTENHFCPLDTIRRTKQPAVVEHIHLDKDGRARYVEVHGYPLLDARGEVSQIIEYCLDITDRKRAERDIRKLNEELEQRVSARTRELSALYDVMAVANETYPLRTTLERSLRRVLRAMECPSGSIHLLDERTGALRLTVHQEALGSAVAKGNGEAPNDGLAEWILVHGKPLVLPDALNDFLAGVGGQDYLRRPYVGVPMRARGQSIGVLGVFGQKERRFTREDVALLSSIADQVAVAVENARLREQAQQAAVLEERQRLARELHDSVSQSIYSLTLFAKGGREFAQAQDLDRVKECLAALGETAQQALKEMRLLLYELRPVALEQEGLIGALQQRLDAVEARSGVEARLLVDGVDMDDPLSVLPSSVEEGLYRIAQEALNNALKHADSRAVTVHIASTGRHVALEVRDDGIGFDPRDAFTKGGMGLISMRERAEQIGGRLEVVSSPGEGTTVRVKVKVGNPVPAEGSQ
jgi:PAS domain S-box-containing protein